MRKEAYPSSPLIFPFPHDILYIPALEYRSGQAADTNVRSL